MHAKSGPKTLDARFPGQWFQVENGLHYNWHRHYDPTIGRYTQPDPLGFVDGPSVFAYARNAPGEEIDPDGRMVPYYFARELAKKIIPLAKPAINYCVRKIKDFFKDEQGARKRDLKVVDDVIKRVEREESINISSDMRRKLHNEIHREFGRGADINYQDILNLARSMFGK